MRLRNMLRICLVFWKSEPQYAYKRYAYKKTYTNVQRAYKMTQLCWKTKKVKLCHKTMLHSEMLCYFETLNS